MDIIITETDRMTHIVQDLLTLSRLMRAMRVGALLLSFGDAIEASPVPMPWPLQHGHTLTYTPPESLP
ncbi:MAG: hypothetical protein ACLTYN_13430 [Dysosmobacter welbionis]